MNYYPVVVQAIPAPNQNIYVYFSDGHIRLYDVKLMIAAGGIFSVLSDDSFFHDKLTVMNGTAAWDLSGNHDPSNCIDIDPFELYSAATVSDPLDNLESSPTRSA